MTDITVDDTMPCTLSSISDLKDDELKEILSELRNGTVTNQSERLTDEIWIEAITDELESRTDRVHAEIQYCNDRTGSIHSDICPPGCKAVFTPEYRNFLHDALNEWLDRSQGTGYFYVTKEGGLF